MKSITIIIPHYNSWSKLLELLETIPKRKEFQVIVVDDNSDNYTENLSSVFSAYPGVEVYINESANKGAGAARNLGLKYAVGEWIVFADSDDLFTFNFFDIIKKYLSTEYDIVYFSPTSFIEDTDIISTRHIQYEKYINLYLDNKNKFNELKIRYFFLVPWSKMIKNKLIQSNNIKFEEIIVSNDILFSAKIGYFAENIKTDRSTIYKVRENKGSLTSVINEKRFKERFNAWVDYVKFLKINLKKTDFKELKVSALPQLYQVYKNNLGRKLYFFIIRKCICNNIPIINLSMINRNNLKMIKK